MIITNLKSQNTGRSLPNQKIMTVETPCGRVSLFQSYNRTGLFTRILFSEPI